MTSWNCTFVALWAKALFQGRKTELQKTPKTLKKLATNSASWPYLGHINRVPYIGGSIRFPPWFRKDTHYRVLPSLIFRKSVHTVTLCEAHDEHNGIAIHQQIARDHSMLCMVVHAEISVPSLPYFYPWQPFCRHINRNYRPLSRWDREYGLT